MKVLVVFMFVAVVAVFGAEECLKACQRNYMPVCATFQKTFPNECTMRAGACEMAKKGYSLLNKAKEGECSCLRACQMNYSPICANDGKTYGNECTLEYESCRQSKFLEKVSEGECQSVVKPEPIA